MPEFQNRIWNEHKRHFLKIKKNLEKINYSE